ncbi:MAG: LPS export ABC transporter periplasmic protein LptC [Cyanobium sp.]
MSVPRLRRLVSAFAVIGLLLPACGTRQTQGGDAGSPPFVFRSLNLRQQNVLGSPTWSLTSPEARYDMRRQVAQAERPSGVIYRRGKEAFRLSALSGTVLNEGQVVILEGRIRVEQLGSRPLLIRAERARWYPRRNLLEMDRHPEAADASNRIRSRRGRYAFDTNLLTLSESPRLEHWTTRNDPFVNRDRGAPETVLHVQEASWNTEGGDLRTKGGVRADRQVPGRSQGTPPQRITASRLEGNTVRQEFWLRGPVRFVDPFDGSELQAGDVRFDLRAQTASSASPFSGQRADLRASGLRFSADAAGHWLTIGDGCLLTRSGDSLQADSCSWNWESQEVSALGDVQLRRQEHQQYSRGGRLTGRLSRDGHLTLSNPGGRVISRLHLPQGPRPLTPPLQPPRRAVAPIRL